MKSTWKWLVPLTLSVFVLSVPVVAMAVVYGGPWDASTANGTVSSVSPSPDGLNITDAYHAYVAGIHYFQINLTGNINTVTGPNSTSLGSYKIFIDLPGGSSPDFVLLYNTSTNGSGKYLWNFTGSTVLTSNLTGNAPTGSSNTQFSSMFLQWAYVDPAGTGHIGQNFDWWAQTLNGSGTPLETTGTAIATPIPNAAWLLGSGIIGLIGLQRRRARKA